MQELLAGQILWVSYAQLWPVAILYAVLLLLWFTVVRTRPGLFYFLFALTVMASVQQEVEQRSEEHTSELQSLMRISYAVFCLKKTKTKNIEQTFNERHR